MSKLFSFSLYYISFAPLWISVLFIDIKSCIENDTDLWTEKTSVGCILIFEFANFRFYNCLLKNEDGVETEQSVISHRKLTACIGETIYLKSLNNEYKLDIKQ